MTKLRKIALIALIILTLSYALARAHTADNNRFAHASPVLLQNAHPDPITRTDWKGMNRAARSIRRYCAKTAQSPAMVSIDLDDHEITGKCLTLP